jgi:hypothetical protein
MPERSGGEGERIGAGQTPDCAECPFVMGLMQVGARARGID